MFNWFKSKRVKSPNWITNNSLIPPSLSFEYYNKWHHEVFGPTYNSKHYLIHPEYIKQNTMRKFKHKKTDMIAEEIHVKGNYKLNNVIWPSQMIEGCNDWEEIKDNTEYEIIDYKKAKIDNISSYGFIEIKIINSVKRLSDGETFSIGDKTIYGHIKSFQEHKNNIYIEITNSNGIKASWNLDAITKQKPLFTTHDEVEIFPGDNFWYIRDYFNISQVINAVDPGPIKVTTFANREKAEQYVIENKPSLSVNDVENICLQQYITPNTLVHRIFMDRLIDTVKGRL